MIHSLSIIGFVFTVLFQSLQPTSCNIYQNTFVVMDSHYMELKTVSERVEGQNVREVRGLI